MAKHALMQVVQQAIILNSRREILVLCRPEGVWQFPGGRLEVGESWEQGLRREIREETGMSDLEVASVLMVDNFVWNEQPLYSAYFLCRTQTSEVTLSNEHIEFRWIGHGTDLSQINFWHNNLRMLVERVLRGNH